MSSVIVLDACCLINLYAADLIGAVDWESTPLVVTPVIRHDETLFLREEHDGVWGKVSLDLGPDIQSGALSEVDRLNPEEVDMKVRFAMQVDDGEAESLAVAYHRGWQLATDDRLAISLAESLDVPVLSTPGLLKAWATGAGVDATDLAGCVAAIERRARYWPGSGHPQYEWWMSVREA